MLPILECSNEDWLKIKITFSILSIITCFYIFVFLSYIIVGSITIIHLNTNNILDQYYLLLYNIIDYCTVIIITIANILLIFIFSTSNTNKYLIVYCINLIGSLLSCILQIIYNNELVNLYQSSLINLYTIISFILKSTNILILIIIILNNIKKLNKLKSVNTNSSIL